MHSQRTLRTELISQTRYNQPTMTPLFLPMKKNPNPLSISRIHGPVLRHTRRTFTLEATSNLFLAELQTLISSRTTIQISSKHPTGQWKLSPNSMSLSNQWKTTPVSVRYFFMSFGLISFLGFPVVQEGSQAKIPVELPDLWAGPSTYAQDYYTGGDVRVSPDVPIDPSLLSGTAGTGDLEDDIDSFLTPAEASVYSSAERTPLSLEEADDEVEDDGDDGQWRSSQRATGTLKSNRAQPIPADAEIIDLDGSIDDEADANADSEAGEENDAELDDDMDDDREVEVDEQPEHVAPDDFVPEGEQIDAEAEEDNEEVNDNSIVPPPALEIREEVSPEPRSEEPKEHEMHDSAFNQASYTVQSPSPILKHAIFRETSLVVDMNSPAPEDKHHPSQHQYQNLVFPSEVVEPPATPPKSAFEELNVVETQEERLEIVTETVQEQESGSPAVLEEAADVSMQADGGQREPAAQEDANDNHEQVSLTVETETVINDAGVPTEATFADLSEAILKPVGGSVEQEDYDIRSTPGSPGKEDEATVQPALPVSSEGADAELSKPAVEPSLRSTSLVAPPITGNEHETDAKELSKKDISVEAVATETEIDNAEQASNDALEAEDAAEEDADGDFDYDDDTQYLEVLSISSGDLFNMDVEADAYSVEEVRTQGRSTEELGDRQTSLRVDSIDPEEVGELDETTTAAQVEEKEQSEAARQNSPVRDLSPSKEEAQVEPITATQEVPLDDEAVSDKPQSVLAETADVEMVDPEVVKDTSTSVPEPSVPTNKEEVEADNETMGRASSVLHDLPMPVVANANVADPVDLPVTPLFEEPGPELLIPVLHSAATTPEPLQLESNADTERNEDVVSTLPAENVPEHTPAQDASGKGPDPVVVHSQEITDTASVEPTPDIAHDSAPADEDTSPATILPLDRAPSPTGVVMSSNPTMPVLVQDPYPYSLSTPGTALEIDVNELVTESEKDNDLDLRFVYEDASNTTGKAKAKSPSAPTAAYVPDVFTNAAPSNAEGSSQSPKDETTTPQPPSKRKRESKKAGSAPRPRGRPRKSAKLQVDLPEATSNETILYNPAKGKSAESRNKSVTGEPSFTSQASSVGQGGQSSLKAGSRSSSIASTIPDDKSFVSQPSPTITKPATAAVPNITIAPLPLFHAHGAARKAQAQKLQALVQQRRPAPSRTPSLPQIPDSNGASVTPKETPVVPKEEKPLEDVAESSNTPTPSPVKAEANGSTTSDPKPALETSPTKPADSKPAESEPATPTAAIPSSSMQVASSPTVAALKASSSTAKASPSHHSTTFSSPVTRSHCRYHRISLPKEEGGTRVCFLVPGCSLNDKELMEEAEIEDHGDATTEDSLRMVKDIESLGFDLDLIGIIRQLVGLDILREQEVYYLPLPGEEITRKHIIRKTPSEKSTTIRASTEKHHASSPSYSGSISIRSPAYPKAPPSVAESTSTTLSALRNMVDPDGDSASSTDEDDMSEAEAPRSKRVKPSPPDEPGVMGPPASQAKGKLKLKYKRVDATYQPGDEHEQESEEETSPKKRRKSTASRGLKRARTSDAIAGHGDGSTRQTKKLKAQITAPQLSSSPQKPENT
ncbi:hypothetical protein CPC08DRAFT_170059 [Agrocybe pediades]|nr:hypothetical protein CPC08DRAFT_170059 [Agrocybe pediades]